MARIIKGLSATEVEKTKPGAKTKNLFDGKGLFLIIQPQKTFPDGKPKPASKWRRFKYTFNGKPGLLSFGTYPEVSLAQARDKRDEARKLIANGVDPAENRKALKAEKEGLLDNSLEAISREWHAHMVKNNAWTEDHAATIYSQTGKGCFSMGWQ